jgi:small multidrug resistance pump
VATAAIGALVFGESMGAVKIACIMLITVGVVGLTLTE